MWFALQLMYSRSFQKLTENKWRQTTGTASEPHKKQYSRTITNINPLSVNLTKWSNTLKQFIGKHPTNCLNVFNHIVGLALKGLTYPILFQRFGANTKSDNNYLILQTGVKVSQDYQVTGGAYLEMFDSHPTYAAGNLMQELLAILCSDIKPLL